MCMFAEEVEPGTVVGRIRTKPGFTYSFNQVTIYNLMLKIQIVKTNLHVQKILIS